MAGIVGKYQHVSNSPDFEDYLKATGSPPELIQHILTTSPVITVSEAGDKWTVSVSNAGKESGSTFKLGEPYDEVLPQGITFKSVTKRDGNKFITDSTVADGRGGTRIYEFTPAGINVTLTDSKSGQKASRVYKRI